MEAADVRIPIRRTRLWRDNREPDLERGEVKELQQIFAEFDRECTYNPQNQWESEDDSRCGTDLGSNRLKPSRSARAKRSSARRVRFRKVTRKWEKQSSHSQPVALPSSPESDRQRKSSKHGKRRIIFDILELLTQNKGTQFADSDASQVRELDFESRLKTLYGSTLIYADKGVVTVNLASLQNITLSRLQRMLVREVFDFRYMKSNSNLFYSCYDGSLMHQYVQALMDWEYIKKCALKGKENDPFIPTTEKTLDLALLKEVAIKFGQDAARGTSRRDEYLLSNLNEDIICLRKLSEPRDKEKLKLFGASRNAMNRKEAFERFSRQFAMPFTGGAFLVGPMLTMVLNSGTLTALLTVSLCVVVFGIVMSFSLDRPFDVLSGTAAYAAVLVVFVGTNNT